MDNNPEIFNIDTAFDCYTSIKFPRWADLPDIDLYMDQVIVLMEKYLCMVNINCNPESKDDKIITSSMVNNYVKMGVMPAPVKKKYSRDHIAHLIIICIMKQSLPISMISTFIKSQLEVMSIEELLDMFIDNYEPAFVKSVEGLRTIYNGIKKTTGSEKNQTAILAIQSTAFANSGKLVGETANDSLANKW